jgi:hypothetical protein
MTPPLYRCKGPCGEELPAEAFARNTRRGKPVITLCLRCVNEQSKRSTRYRKILPRIADEARAWHPLKLASEIEWLHAQLRELENEARWRMKDAA